MTSFQELPIPPLALKDSSGREIARVWAAHGSQHVSLAADLWDDPFAWGMMLVDLANHVANAYEQGHGRDRQEVLARIRAGFEAEWQNPTDEARGEVLEWLAQAEHGASADSLRSAALAAEH